ncbi:hypothetical protein MBLNU230_g1990t1 [Neophaeotheca triangularis]
MDYIDEKARNLPIPIPSYEEATSSRPESSQEYSGTRGTSDEAERQGLLGRQQDENTSRRNGDYHAPTVESARSSLESDLHLPEVDGDDARRNIEELDYMDPEDGPDTSRRSPRLYHRSRIRTKHWGQRLSNLGATLSSLRLPNFRSLYNSVPTDSSNNNDDDNNNTSTTTPPAEQASSTPNQPQAFIPRLRSSLPVPAMPEEYRLSAPIFARLCGLFIIASAIWALFALDLFPGGHNIMAARFDPESVRGFVQEHMKADAIQEYNFHASSYDHVAGTEGDLYLARWLEEAWSERGRLDELALLDYFVLLDYPTKKGRGVRVVGEGGFEATLEEERVDKSMATQQTLVWHGHSGDGEVEGPLVYANGGSREDFEWLRGKGVSLNGTVALVRYYATEMDLDVKIQAAEEAGCVGVLVFSDPSEDQDGRPADAVHRGSVSRMNQIMGDPLTPGFASTEKAKRKGMDGNPALPGIPSLPLSWRDAQELVKALENYGEKVPKKWRGGDDKFQAKWYTGSSDNGPTVHLKNKNDHSKKQQIWNLHGLIQGYEQPSKKVIVGSHRDSWCFGAADPGSSTAVMTHVIEIIGKLRAIGWRPLRSIEFISWDATAYNAIGSTEYVEDHTAGLRKSAIAYLNVDVGVSGPQFSASGSPLWQRALAHVLDRVPDPTSNDSLRHLWETSDSHFSNLGAEGDATPWQQIAGTSSLDMGFAPSDDRPHAYPAGSCYDNHEWMQKVGDPGFEHHKALAQVWALLILELADQPLIPYDVRTYAAEVKNYISDLQNFVRAVGDNNNNKPTQSRDDKDNPSQHENLDLTPLRSAAELLTSNAETLHRFEEVWTTNVMGRGGLETTSYALQRVSFNERLTDFETALLDLPSEGGGDGKRDADPKKEHSHPDGGGYGVPGREQYKHVLFGPTAKTGRKGFSFPAVRDAVERGQWKEAERLVQRAAGVLERAAGGLALD